MWLLTKAKTSTRPRASVTRPARALVPRRVPVLARTQPRPGEPSKRSASDPSYAATGRPVTTGRSSGWSADEASWRTDDQGLGLESVVPGEPAAVVDPGAAQVDAETGQGLPHGRRAAGEGAVTVHGQAGLVAEHLGALVVADLQHLLDDVGERPAGHPRHLRAHRGAGRSRTGPVTRTPPLAEERRELAGGARGGVGLAAAAAGRHALVGPQRGDRGDLVVGDVGRSARCGLSSGPVNSEVS